MVVVVVGVRVRLWVVGVEGGGAAGQNKVKTKLSNKKRLNCSKLLVKTRKKGSNVV